MDSKMILEVVRVLVFVLFGGLSIYLQYNKKLQQKIADITAQAIILIKEAEFVYKDTTKAGGTKFKYVVDKLYNLVPKTLRVVITRETVEDIVQRTFDAVEEYAREQLDKATDTQEDEEQAGE